MSILIKGVSMPKYGELNITIDALGGVAYTDKDMKEHEVIEVPTPHGEWKNGVCNQCGFDCFGICKSTKLRSGLRGGYDW